jgi:hypothetical protein
MATWSKEGEMEWLVFGHAKPRFLTNRLVGALDVEEMTNVITGMRFDILVMTL